MKAETWQHGLPQRDGEYLVKLLPGNVENKEYDIDYCCAGCPSDGGGREWIKWYEHNIECWQEW